MSSVEQHNLKLLKEKVNSLLENEQYKHALKNNLTFNFDKPEDLLTSDVFSLLLKPASLIKTLEGHKNEVQSVAFSPDSKLIASASDDCKIRLWNIPSGDLNAELKGHTSWVSSVAFSPDGKSIVTSSGDHTVRTWSIATKKQSKTLYGHSDDVMSVAWSPNGALIASGSADETVSLWDVTSGSATKTLTGHTESVMSVSFSQNGNKLASGGDDNTAIIWDVLSGAAHLTLVHSDSVFSACFSPDDQFVVTVTLFACLMQTLVMKKSDFRVWSVAISFDGSMIASGSADNSVRLWDVASTKQLQQLDGHNDIVESVAFSRDGKFIASSSDDNTVCLWNAPLVIQIPHQPKEQEEEENRKRQKIDH